MLGLILVVALTACADSWRFKTSGKNFRVGLSYKFDWALGRQPTGGGKSNAEPERAGLANGLGTTSQTADEVGWQP